MHRRGDRDPSCSRLRRHLAKAHLVGFAASLASEARKRGPARAKGAKPRPHPGVEAESPNDARRRSSRHSPAPCRRRRRRPSIRRFAKSHPLAAPWAAPQSLPAKRLSTQSLPARSGRPKARQAGVRHRTSAPSAQVRSSHRLAARSLGAAELLAGTSTAAARSMRRRGSKESRPIAGALALPPAPAAARARAPRPVDADWRAPAHSHRSIEPSRKARMAAAPREVADEPLGLRVARAIFGGLQPFEDAGDDLALFGGHGFASIASRHVRLDAVAKHRKPSRDARECAETPCRAWRRARKAMSSRRQSLMVATRKSARSILGSALNLGSLKWRPSRPQGRGLLPGPRLASDGAAASIHV